MKIRHIKNLYWLIIVISLVLAFAFSSSPFIFYTGIITSIFAFISILIGKPFILWMFWLYIIIINLPFAIPYLLWGWICKSIWKKNGGKVYGGGACILAIIELILVCQWLGASGLWFLGSIIFMPLAILGMFFDETNNA